MLLTCFCFVSSTYAWLVAKTEPIVNTFTAGNINISLGAYTGTSFKMIPGAAYSGDAHVTVVANSEDCWLFIKIEKSENFDTFMTFEVPTTDSASPDDAEPQDVDWLLIKSDGNTSVYCHAVDYAEQDQVFHILKEDANGNSLFVKTEVTKTQLDTVTTGNQPKLTFTAYAVQRLGFENDPMGAWAEAENLDTSLLR